MRRIVGSVFLSLDGVIQAPGGPEEDRSGGFPHGGWFAGQVDEWVGERIGAFFARPFDLLLGRRTWEIFAGHWPYVTGAEAAFAATFNAANKYVLTRGGTPLDWENSHPLPDMDAVAALKSGEGPDLIVQGSSTLYPELFRHRLIDQLVTYTCPLVLGGGKRLFDAATTGSQLVLTEHSVSPGGVVIATYEPAGAVRSGSFAAGEPSAREMARRDRIATTGSF
jgi:dihydrofolate reductase